MSIQILGESEGSVNLSGTIPRSRLIEMHRFMKEHFSKFIVDIDSERCYTDDRLNFIQMQICYDVNAKRPTQPLKLFDMVWG